MSSFFNLFRKSKKTRSTPSVAPQNTSTDLEEKAENLMISETALNKSTVGSVQTSGKDSLASVVKNFPLYEAGDLIAGQFQVTDRLEGSMAYVYLAYDKIQDISYAIKQPKQTLLADPAFSSRLLRVANAWTELGMHPHIAYCYFIRNIEDVPHLFVEHVAGGNLREWIEADQCDDLRVSLNWAIQVCHGMEKAHESHLIHGNIKPENILISREGVVRITDFGIRGESPRYQQSDNMSLDSESGISLVVMIGTHAYMSPEQLLDPRQRSIDAPEGVWYDSDIYSFGVCLWEMIVNQQPYSMAPSTEEMPDPQDFRKDIPESLRSLLSDVIAIDRSERPQYFKALRESLNDIHQELFHFHAPSYTIELPKDNAAHVLNNQGFAYLEQSDIAHARICFEKAIEISRTHLQSTYNLSLIQWCLGEISDDDALSRLEYCKKDPAFDRQILDELIAQVQAERFDLNAAKRRLKDYPGRYDVLFGDMEGRQARCLHTLVGHSGWINSVAMTPDGSRGLSGSDDKTVRLWNLETGDCLHTLEGHEEWITAVALTSDGCLGLSGSNDKTVRLWDLKTGENLQTLKGHESVVTSVGLSADGSLALSGSNDKTLVLWNLKTGECVHTLYGHTGRVRSVALTPDGDIGLSGSNDNTLRFWDLNTGQCVGTTEECVGRIQSVALSTDGRSGLSGNRDGTLCLWNPENEAHQHRFEGHSMPVESVALTADARWALSASRDTTLRLWELETGQSFRVITGQLGHVLSLAITPDGQRILTGNYEKEAQLWELPLQNKYLASFRIAPPQSLIKKEKTEVTDQPSPTEKEEIKEKGVVDTKPATEQEETPETGQMDQEPVTEKEEIKETGVLNQDHAIEVEEEHETEVTHEKRSTHLEDTSDRTTNTDAWVTLRETWKNLKYAEDASIVQQYNPLFAQRQATTLLKVNKLHRLEGNNDGFFAVSQSRDGRWGLSGNADATLSFWDLETGENLRTLEGHTDIVSAVAMTSDGRRGLSASTDATLRFWNLNTGECLRIMRENTNPFTSVDMTPDGHWAITGQRHGFAEEPCLLILWDLTTGQCVHAWKGHGEQVRSVALSSDSHWGLSGGTDNTLRLWNLKTRENVHVLNGHTHGVNAVAMTPDGRWGLSGSHDTTLRFWDLQAGSCKRELEGHSAAVRSVTLTDDGRWGLSGALDDSLRLWNLETGECIKTLAWHTGYITSVAMTFDGCLGLSASMDNTLVRWRLIWDLALAAK